MLCLRAAVGCARGSPASGWLPARLDGRGRPAEADAPARVGFVDRKSAASESYVLRCGERSGWLLAVATRSTGAECPGRRHGTVSPGINVAASGSVLGAWPSTMAEPCCCSADRAGLRL